MSDHDDQNPRKVGYRNPPRGGQFRKGVSGNPRGRPRKHRDEPSLPDHRVPTVQEVIRAEINRNIPITDSRGRHTITTKHAVVRAMAATAIKGGVLAQRTYLDLAEKEEKRHQKERRKSFRFWRDYKDKWDARIAAGEPRPDDEPDPDDIVLDWRTQEVRIEGPMDKEDRAAAELVCAYRDLCFEMAIYHEEVGYMVGEDGLVTQMGVYLGIHLVCQRFLWPRMRELPEALDEQIRRRASLGLYNWGNDLKARCEALGLPFLPRKRNAAPLMVPLAKLGIKKPIEIPLTPPVTRRQRRRRDASANREAPRQAPEPLDPRG